MQKPRIYIIDILRGILALSIMGYHYSIWTKFPWPPYLASIIHKFGYYGVLWFFIISGFSMAYSYSWNDINSVKGLTIFYVKRFFRIAPLFALAAVLTVLVGYVEFDFHRLIFNMLLLFQFYGLDYSIPTGGWSIGVEALFYLVFPFLIFLNAKLKKMLLVFLATLFSIGFSLIAYRPSYSYLQYTVFYSFYYLYLFVFGMYIANVASLGVNKPNFFNKKFGYVFALLSVLFLVDWDYAHYDHISVMINNNRYVLCMVLITYAVIRGLEKSKISSFKSLRLLGDLSYSIYLLHPVIYYFWGQLIHKILYVAILSILTTFILSYFVYHHFERKIMLKLSERLKSL